MIRLDAAQTRQVLDYVSIATEIDRILELKTARLAFAPERIVLSWNETDCQLVMPAYDDQWLMNKRVTVHRSNPQRGLPMIQGEVVLIRRADGARRLELDGSVVTAMRTAAVSLVAIQKMGYGQAESFTVCGAGVQALAHVEAIFQWNPLCQIRLFARHRAKAITIVETLRNRGCRILIAEDLSEAIANSTVVVTATSSQQPFVYDSMIALERKTPLLFVAVGAYCSNMAELAPDLLRRVTGPIGVDAIEGASKEAGDLLGANVVVDRMLGLEQIDPRQLRGNMHVFKSVGNALWDLAAARAAYLQLANQQRIED